MTETTQSKENEAKGVRESLDRFDSATKNISLVPEGNEVWNEQFARDFSSLVDKAAAKGETSKVAAENALLELVRGPHHDAALNLITQQHGKKVDAFVTKLQASRQENISDDERTARRGEVSQAHIGLGDVIPDAQKEQFYETISDIIKSPDVEEDKVEVSRKQLENATKTDTARKLVTYRQMAREIKTTTDPAKQTELQGKFAALYSELTETAADKESEFKIEDALLEIAKNPEEEVEASKQKVLAILSEEQSTTETPADSPTPTSAEQNSPANG